MTKKFYNQDYFFDPDYIPLKLRAEDTDDIAVISTLIQDSLVPEKSIHYDAETQTFSILINRFRWEDSAKDDALEQNERVFAMLALDHVTHCNMENFNEKMDEETHHNLLCLQAEGDHITLFFSGDEAIQLTISQIHAKLKDVSDPWPTEVCPIHKAA